MEFIGRIFFPKANNSSEENSKEENQQEDREDDFYDDGSYDPRRVDLANSKEILKLFYFLWYFDEWFIISYHSCFSKHNNYLSKILQY